MDIENEFIGVGSLRDFIVANIVLRST
jgi:hypothetical protein